MSFIRASSTRKYSEPDTPMYVFVSAAREEGDKLEWMLGSPNSREDLSEVMFQILSQAGVDVDLEMVNKVRDRMGVEPLDELKTDDSGLKSGKEGGDE